MFNSNLIADTPKYFRQDAIFIDMVAFVRAMNIENKKLGIQNSSEEDGSTLKPVNMIYFDLKDNIIGSKIDSCLAIFRILQRNSREEWISERDLRKILFENLDNLNDFHLTTIVSNLPSSK